MSRISYFQRFSQSENHATNNTLLVLRYFYEASPFKIQRVLTSLLETELSIGLTFDQQRKGDASIPDGFVTQASLKIFLETKRGDAFDAKQIRRHLKSIVKSECGGDGTFLIGLSKEPIGDFERNRLTLEAAAHKVIFVAITFTQIVESLKSQCAEYERELVAIVDDYEEYLFEEGLMVERTQKLAIFPCGTSSAENVKFDLYYEPPSRRLKQNQFIGVYRLRRVSHVGAVQTVAVCTYRKNVPSFDEECGHLSNEQRERIIEVIRDTAYYDLRANPHRFYLVDHFMETDCKKSSPGGIMGMRYLDFSKLSADFNPKKSYSTADLATLLKGTTWA